MNPVKMNEYLERNTNDWKLHFTKLRAKASGKSPSYSVQNLFLKHKMYIIIYRRFVHVGVEAVILREMQG